MNKSVTILILGLLITTASFAQDGVKWHTIGEVDELLKTNPKPIFVDSYTDWCGWCKRLDKDTFSDPIIAKYLNDNFIPVKFNAESKEEITFLGKKFINDGTTGKAHQLAVALMQGKLSYPTVIFLNEKGELLSPVPGYQKPKDLEPILVFFGEKKYLTDDWVTFQKSFKGSF